MAHDQLRRPGRLYLFLTLAVTLGTGCPAPEGRAQDAPPPDQNRLNRDAAQAFEEVDRRLNVLYRRVLAQLPEARRPALRAAQRAWVTWRDAEAAFQASEMAGGSAEPMLRAGARTRLTRDRTTTFQALLDNP